MSNRYFTRYDNLVKEEGFSQQEALDAINRNIYQDGAHIWNGACNPVAVANSLAEATHFISHYLGGHPAVKEHPAIRLMVYQLSFVIFGTEYRQEDLVTQASEQVEEFLKERTKV